MDQFAFDLRVLTCGSCTAPLDVPSEGGTVTCSYCGAVSAYGAQHRSGVSAASALGEAARVARLRAQPAHVVEVPPDVAHLFVDGVVPDAHLEAAKSALVEARATLAARPDDPEAQARVLVLTLQVGRGDDPRGWRAAVEAALELLPPGAFTQELYGKLARGAALSGDLLSAERWLSLLEPRSDLLQLDGIYRLTKAYVETARGNPQGALDTLVFERSPVPVHPGAALLADTLRANAFEKTGRLDDAEALLRDMIASGTGVDATLSMVVRANVPLDLCPESLPRARAPRSAPVEVAAPRSSPSGPGLATLAVAAALLLVALLTAVVMVVVLGRMT